MKRRLIAVALLGVCVVLAVIEAKSQGPGTDFHARWIFGRWFWSGEPLYVDVPGVRGPNLYPPFAAMLFQLHTLLPLKLAAGVFYFCNLLLIPLSVRWSKDICDALWLPPPPPPPPPPPVAPPPPPPPGLPTGGPCRSPSSCRRNSS